MRYMAVGASLFGVRLLKMRKELLEIFVVLIGSINAILGVCEPYMVV